MLCCPVIGGPKQARTLVTLKIPGHLLFAASADSLLPHRQVTNSQHGDDDDEQFGINVDIQVCELLLPYAYGMSYVAFVFFQKEHSYFPEGAFYAQRCQCMDFTARTVCCTK